MWNVVAFGAVSPLIEFSVKEFVILGDPFPGAQDAPKVIISSKKQYLLVCQVPQKCYPAHTETMRRGLQWNLKPDQSIAAVMYVIDRHVMYTGGAFDPLDIESKLDQVNAKTVRETCMEYIYDKCPAIVGYGE